MQPVLCHQFDQAEADLNLWPGASRDEMKEEFTSSVKEDRAEFAARLGGVKPAQ